ncbi:MAG: bifunctional metallophosphatase/5'-nucleotidase, partial [Armatimonadota bacterium]
MLRLCWRSAVLLWCLYAALFGTPGRCVGAEKQRLTILHTNDLHGMMMPFDYPGAPLQHVPPMKNVGGLARRAGLVKRIRSAAKNPVLVLDAGDVFTRGPWHGRFYGEPEIEAMNLMGYDAMCVGNNEFQATGNTEAQAKMLTLMRRSRFPWIAANLTQEVLTNKQGLIERQNFLVGDTGVPVEGIHPFVVRRAGSLRVGLLGLTAERSAYYPQTRGWTISDAVEAAKHWVPIARRECDVLIAVTHVGIWRDRQIARQVAGIDAIVGGDTHTFVHTPEMVRNPNGVLVPIVQAGECGVMLGKLDLVFEKRET